MIKRILGCWLAVSVLSAADPAGSLAEQIAVRTYELTKKQHKAAVRKENREINNHVAAAPEFDKVDLSRFRIRAGSNRVSYENYDFIDADGYPRRHIYASNMQQVIDHYLKNPNLPLTAAQTDFSLVFAAPQPDPKRSGYDYAGIKSGYVSIISRALPSGYAIENDNVNGESAAEVLMKALLWNIFSSERALALYTDVIMQMGEEDPEEKKKAYRGMAKDLGIKSASEEEKKEQKKQIKKDAKESLQKAKEALGIK